MHPTLPCGLHRADGASRRAGTPRTWWCTWATMPGTRTRSWCCRCSSCRPMRRATQPYLIPNNCPCVAAYGGGVGACGVAPPPLHVATAVGASPGALQSPHARVTTSPRAVHKRCRPELLPITLSGAGRRRSCTGWATATGGRRRSACRLPQPRWTGCSRTARRRSGTTTACRRARPAATRGRCPLAHAAARMRRGWPGRGRCSVRARGASA